MIQPPETALLRLRQIIGDPKTSPPTHALINVSKSTWWKGVAEGRYPQPLKIGPRTTVWRAKDIYKFIEQGVV